MPRVVAPARELFRPRRRESLVENVQEADAFIEHLKSNNIKAVIDMITKEPERM